MESGRPVLPAPADPRPTGPTAQGRSIGRARGLVMVKVIGPAREQVSTQAVIRVQKQHLDEVGLIDNAIGVLGLLRVLEQRHRGRQEDRRQWLP